MIGIDGKDCRREENYRTRIGFLTMLLHTTKSQEQRRAILEELDRLRAEMKEAEKTL